MKGLFMKDFGLLKGQKQFFAVIVVMTVIFMTAYRSEERRVGKECRL